MSRFQMSRINSLLLRATLLTGLVGFAHGAAFAEGPNSDIANIVQPPPPRALIETQQAPAPGAPRVPSGPEQRVALVIGNSNYRNAPQLANPDHDAQSMAQFLNSAGFEVVEATDGADALRVLGSHPDVRLIICDVAMPVMDGLEFLQRLADRPEGRPSVLMLTTEAQPELIYRAKALGAQGWISKPCRPEHLVASVVKLFGDR